MPVPNSQISRCKMPLIQVEFVTDDKSLQELCTAYWQGDDEGKFTQKVADIAARFNLQVHEVATVVRKHCRAFRTDRLCENCGKPVKYLDSRADLSIRWRSGEELRFCETCQHDIDERKQQERQNQAKILKRQKEAKMHEALQNGVYETLNLLEFNFLVALATTDDFDVARKKVGLSEKDATTIFGKLNDLHLVNHRVGIQGYALLGELETALQGIGYQRRVKPIFGSPKSLELYRKLKGEYLFVFPEIPICAFIDKAQVEHLFTENWHAMYFLTARVDFVVCDPEGKPIFAVEYQGGYHKSHDQIGKDKFKRIILNEVGLPLREITHKDLQGYGV